MIAQELKDYVSRAYVCQCLDPDQKRSPRGSPGGAVCKLVYKMDGSGKGSETEEEDTEIIWLIKPEEYLVQDVDQYDRACLIRIVKYQDTEYTKQKFYVEKTYRTRLNHYRVRTIS